MHRFSLPIKSEEDLREFVWLSWGVRIPDIQVCEGHVSPWRAFSDAYFAIDPVSVWKASRGFGGKSYLLALLGLTEAVTLKADVNILGGSGLQSERVHSYMQEFWNYDNAPRFLLASDPIKRETRLGWGCNIRALMASMSSVRGPHPQRLRMDEIDEMDLRILEAAQGQTMGKGDIRSQTVMSSTHQYAAGTMTEVLKRAKGLGWGVYQWCYRETSADPVGWLDKEEVARKRTEVTKAMWLNEYELQDPSPESRAIDGRAVGKMFRRGLGEFVGANNEYIEIEEPEEGADYAHGADWARKQDWTVIITFRVDVNPIRLVAFKRMGRMPWDVMVGELDKRVARYGGSGSHDGTGLGDVVDGYLQSPGIEPVVMVGRRRSDLLSQYIAGIERGEIESPYIEFMENEHRLASVDDIYGSGHLPDSIAAGALAYNSRVAGVYFR